MKSSYELAMERLNKSQPASKLNAAQKRDIAELESKYEAKIAEREIMMKDEINAAAGAGDWEKQQKIKAELVHERKKLQAELEEKKDAVRQGKG